MVTRTVLDCNWLQSVESHIDSSHFGILHQDWNPFGNLADTNQRQLLRGDTDLSTSDNAPTLKVEDTEFGFYTAAIRKARRNDEPVLYARIHAFALPWVALIPPGAVSFEVPMTDDRVNVTQVLFSPDHSVDPASVRKMLGEGRYTEVLSDGVQYFKGNAANRYLQDREAMRSGSFTGVDALLVEDLSVVVSMTSVVDRTKEHLVPADRAVMHLRRQLLKAAADLQEGTEPRHLRAEEARSIVPVEGVLREDEEWQTLLPHPPVVNP